MKYDYTNFTIQIIEYCDPNKVIAREQNYLDVIRWEYNILRVAGSRLGVPHTALTKKKLRAAWTSEKRASVAARLD